MTEALNIDVTISQELRDLVAGRDLIALAGKADRNAAARPPVSDHTRAMPTGTWSLCRLRRDGARPLVFNGLPVVSHEGSLQADGCTYRHGFSIYVSALREIYVHLTLAGPDDAPRRPLNRCERLDATRASGLLQSWVAEVVGHLTGAAIPGAKIQTDVLDRSALAQDLTAQGLLANPVPA